MQTSVAQQPTKERVLDVLTIPAPSPQADLHTMTECGCGSASTQPDVQAPRLTVTLVRVTPAEVTVGDEVVFEMNVEHHGGAPVVLPISRDPDLARSCQMAKGDVFANSALFLKNADAVIAVGPRLSGSATMVDTTLTLQAGERLRVRVPAVITSMDPGRPVSDMPQQMQVDAALMVQYSGCGSLFVRSTNEAALQVWRPR